MDRTELLAEVQIGYDSLLKGRDMIGDHSLRHTTELALSHQFFQLSPAGRKHHANFEGGLVLHTADVMKIVLQMLLLPEHRYINKDVLLTAIIWHDFGKIFCYRAGVGKDSSIEYTLANKRLYHIVLSITEFATAADLYEVSESDKFEVMHCIYSHHGRPDWGSPIEPQTPEAWLLHLSDMMSVFSFEGRRNPELPLN